jgi:hypothetical protein
LLAGHTSALSGLGPTPAESVDACHHGEQRQVSQGEEPRQELGMAPEITAVVTVLVEPMKRHTSSHGMKAAFCAGRNLVESIVTAESPDIQGGLFLGMGPWESQYQARREGG